MVKIALITDSFAGPRESMGGPKESMGGPRESMVTCRWKASESSHGKGDVFG